MSNKLHSSIERTNTITIAPSTPVRNDNDEDDEVRWINFKRDDDACAAYYNNTTTSIPTSTTCDDHFICCDDINDDGNNNTSNTLVTTPTTTATASITTACIDYCVVNQRNNNTYFDYHDIDTLIDFRINMDCKYEDDVNSFAEEKLPNDEDEWNIDTVITAVNH